MAKIANILGKIKPSKIKRLKLVMDQIYMVPSEITIDDHFNYSNKEEMFDRWQHCKFVKYKGRSSSWDAFYPDPDDGFTNFYVRKGVWTKKVKPIKEVRFVQS